LAKLDMNTGARISLLVNIAALAAGLAVASRELLKRLGSRHDWHAVLTISVLAAILGIDKIRGELQMLQTNTLVLLAMMLGLLLLDKRPAWAGAALGFAINVKYQALALLLYLLFRRRWKAAGATILWAAAWGLLPSISVGFRQDLNYLAQGFTGVLRLMGVHTAADAANIEPIGSGLSISITSAAARFLTAHQITMSPFIPSGIIALAWLAVLAWCYHRQKVPAILWPRARAQTNLPFAGLAAMEWLAVIAAVLAFSPQTNTRHLVLTTLMFILGWVLLFETKGRGKWLPACAMLILWMGLNLPPGHRTEDGQSGTVAFWHRIGGPSWALLASMLLLAWPAIAVARARQPKPLVISPIL
ncbi:MAG TPA: glycosyltransferase 87 family protein, partial [Phycisphaerae bacterium]